MANHPKIDFVVKRCFWVVPIVRMYGFFIQKVLRLDEQVYEMKVNPHIFFLGKKPIQSWIYWISIKFVKRGES